MTGKPGRHDSRDEKCLEYLRKQREESEAKAHAGQPTAEDSNTDSSSLRNPDSQNIPK